MTDATSKKLFARATRVIPGGVNSPVRAWKAVGGTPRFLCRGAGSTVTDVDGNTYIDYVGSWGPMILGHAHPEVVRAVEAALKDGTSFGAPTEREVRLAERIAAALPAAEQVRLVNSGTEAGMTAIRLARGFTGRTKIIKFAGCYHGHSDSLLVRAGSGAMTLGVPDSPGVPEVLAGETLIATYNDPGEVERLLSAHAGDVACVIVEPVAGNIGVVLPEPGFLESLRAMTAAHGALLIFDEVMTGFRVAYGGVQVQCGVRPDIVCLGKVIGGGLPLAALGGRREVMERLAPTGPVYQAGTLSGNPLAVAAGLATTDQLKRPGVYERLEELGERLEKGFLDALRQSGRPGCVNRAGSMWTLFLGVESVRNCADAQAAAVGPAFARFFTGMLEHGIYLPPSPFEAAFISLAHSEAEIDRTVEVAREVIGEL